MTKTDKKNKKDRKRFNKLIIQSWYRNFGDEASFGSKGEAPHSLLDFVLKKSYNKIFNKKFRSLKKAQNYFHACAFLGREIKL